MIIKDVWLREIELINYCLCIEKNIEDINIIDSNLEKCKNYNNLIIKLNLKEEIINNFINLKVSWYFIFSLNKP